MPRRFNEAIRHFGRILQEKWWYGLFFVILELSKDRLAAWGNKQIDENAGWLMETLTSIASYLGAAPLSWTIAAAVVVLISLFVHSYFFDPASAPVKENHAPKSEAPSAAPSKNLETLKAAQEHIRALAEPSIQGPVYEHWDSVEVFTVAQAVCLWCDQEPMSDFHYRTKRTGKISAVEQMFVGAISDKFLSVDSSKNGFAVVGDYSKSLVRRCDLVGFAESKEQRPKFLYPEER